MTQYTPISKGAVKFKNFAEMKHPTVYCQKKTATRAPQPQLNQGVEDLRVLRFFVVFRVPGMRTVTNYFFVI